MHEVSAGRFYIHSLPLGVTAGWWWQWWRVKRQHQPLIHCSTPYDQTCKYTYYRKRKERKKKISSDSELQIRKMQVYSSSNWLLKRGVTQPVGQSPINTLNKFTPHVIKSSLLLRKWVPRGQPRTTRYQINHKPVF